MKLGDMIIRKGVNPIDALKIFSFAVPYLLGFILPLSFLLGILLVMGRLISDNEMTAISATGISPLRILNIFLILAAILALFIFLLNNRFIPTAHYNYRNYTSGVCSQSMANVIEPGVFLENFADYVIYVSDKEDNKLKNVFIYETDRVKGVNKVTFAKRGEFAVDGDWMRIKLEEGFRDEPNPKNKRELYRLNFKVSFVDIHIEKKNSIVKKPSDMVSQELKDEIKRLKRKGIKPVELETEFHKRISFSFSPIIFAFLAYGASFSIKHREKSINFGIAFLTAGIYYMLMMLGQSLAESCKITPALGMWLPNIIIGAVGAFLMRKNIG